MGSGGREVAYSAGRKLGYRVATKDLIMADMKKYGPDWEDRAKILDEHRPTIWERNDWSFRGFCALLQDHIFSYALDDNVVIMGRGGNFLLEDIPHVLRIRIVAPLEAKTERLIRREGIDYETARRLAEETDDGRAGFIKAVYAKSWDDPAGYDRIYDSGAKPIGEIVDEVCSALIEKDRLNNEDARRLLSLRALAARIKARILTDKGLFVPVFDAVAEGDKIVLKGVVHKPQEHERIDEAARSIAGDVAVRCELRYRA